MNTKPNTYTGYYFSKPTHKTFLLWNVLLIIKDFENSQGCLFTRFLKNSTRMMGNICVS